MLPTCDQTSTIGRNNFPRPRVVQSLRNKLGMKAHFSDLVAHLHPGKKKRSIDWGDLRRNDRLGRGTLDCVQGTRCITNSFDPVNNLRDRLRCLVRDLDPLFLSVVSRTFPSPLPQSQEACLHHSEPRLVGVALTTFNFISDLGFDTVFRVSGEYGKLY